MKTILTLEIKKTLRDRIMWILPFVGVLYFIYGLRLLGYFGYSQLSWHMQLMYFWAALIGYRSTLEWKQKALVKFLWDERTKAKVILAQFLACVSFTMVTTLVFMFIYITVGVAQKVTTPLLFEGAGSIFLHYGLGMLFCTGIGLVTGRVFSNRWGYLVPIAVVFLLGPMGFSLLLNVTRLIPVNLAKLIFGPFELGIHNDNLKFVSLYGFSLERTMWLQAAMRMTFILFLLFLPIYHQKKAKSIGALLLICTLGFFVLQNIPEGYLHQSVWQESQSSRPIILRYVNSERPLSLSGKGTFQKMSAIVSTENELNVKAEGQWRMGEKSSTITLNLYRDLVVNQILVNDQKVSFDQVDDFIYVQLPSTFSEGEILQVTINYEGTTPNMYFASKKATFLPSYFNWLPQPALAPTFGHDGSLLANPIYDKQPIDYKIKWSDTSGVSLMTDASNYGVTLISGYYKTYENDNIHYYVAAPGEIEALITSTRQFLPLMADIQSFFGGPIVAIKNVVANMDTLTNIGYEEMPARLSGSTLFVTENFSYEQTADIINHGVASENDVGIVSSALGAILLDNVDFLEQDTEMKEAFMQAFLYWKYHSPLEDTEIKDTIDHAQNPERFIKDWYALMVSKKNVQWEDVLTLVR